MSPVVDAIEKAAVALADAIALLLGKPVISIVAHSADGAIREIDAAALERIRKSQALHQAAGAAAHAASKQDFHRHDPK